MINKSKIDNGQSTSDLKRWPALDVDAAGQPDLLLAMLDDCGPSALEEHGATLRAFFPTAEARDAAEVALRPRFSLCRLEVPDQDWARRSQENLAPVTVGRVTIATPWAARTGATAVQPSRTTLDPPRTASRDRPVTIVIAPSMGFGTGHHATTKLCLAALQLIELTDRSVFDVGTGSGILAIAAVRLGAARAVGIDVDADAIHSASENLALNNEIGRRVVFMVGDLTVADLPQADVVTANLTGALLVRAASRLAGRVRSGGVLIASGLLASERDEVRYAFRGFDVTSERDEDGWICLTTKKP